MTIRIADVEKHGPVDFRRGFIKVEMSKTHETALIPLTTELRECLLTLRKKAVVGEFDFLTESGQPFSIATVRRYHQPVGGEIRIPALQQVLLALERST